MEDRLEKCQEDMETSINETKEVIREKIELDEKYLKVNKRLMDNNYAK